MKIIRIYINFLVLVLPLLSFSQNIENIHFEQVGKQIHIYYDLEGSETYTVQVFCSTDNGQNWGEPLKHVSGAIGENQKAGNGKMIVWDVLKEQEKLSGEIIFRIIVVPTLIGNSGFFRDKRDEKKYKWVRIGDQVWMAENLNYKAKYSWCYDNKETNCNKYGRLYYWHLAITVCPNGWHLPSDGEWKTLEMHLGMSKSEADDAGWRGTDEGGKMKETGTTHWWSPNTGATNTSGFTALPGSYRSSSRSFYHLGGSGYWWSSTEYSSADAWRINLYYDDDQVDRGSSFKANSFSVRCVRD